MGTLNTACLCAPRLRVEKPDTIHRQSPCQRDERGRRYREDRKKIEEEEKDHTGTPEWKGATYL